MMPLIEALYHMTLDNWNIAMGLLDGEEYQEYQRSCCFFEEQKEQLTQQLTGDKQAAWKRCLANLEQVRNTECRLLFARGLAMGLCLGGFVAGE